jgi:hypothetical protein
MHVVSDASRAQVDLICALGIATTEALAAALIGESARGYQRTFAVSAARSAQHAATQAAYLCATALHEECSLMPRTGMER